MTDDNKTASAGKPDGDRPRKRKKSADFRYQVRHAVNAPDNQGVYDSGWVDSAKSYKGPTEALKASEDDAEVKAGPCIVRVIRVASPEFESGVVQKVQLKKRTT